MRAQDIKKVIIDQRNEIKEMFERERMITRAVPSLLDFLKHPNVLAVLGVRRCGKSVLSHQLLEGIEYGYVNFDDERLSGMDASDLNNVLSVLYELYGDKLEYFIFDEIQNVPRWELFASRLRRTKSVIVTGSNANLLSGELATHLTGRHIDFTLYPFSFAEFLDARNIKMPQGGRYSTADESAARKHLEEYIALGGFPEAGKFGAAMLARIYSDIIQKDAVMRYGIRNRKTFAELARYLVSNLGNEITYSRLRGITSIKNIHTVKNYIGYLSDVHLVMVLERFSFKLKQQYIAPKKVYCIDTGIANSVAFEPSESKGRLMENIVAIELFRRKAYWSPMTEIYYWKDAQQREVDFVLKGGKDVKTLVQVCYDAGGASARKREVSSLIKAGAELRCNDMRVITWEEEGEEVHAGTKITFVPLWKWLLEK